MLIFSLCDYGISDEVFPAHLIFRGKGFFEVYLLFLPNWLRLGGFCKFYHHFRIRLYFIWLRVVEVIISHNRHLNSDRRLLASLRARRRQGYSDLGATKGRRRFGNLRKAEGQGFLRDPKILKSKKLTYPGLLVVVLNSSYEARSGGPYFMTDLITGFSIFVYEGTKVKML